MADICFFHITAVAFLEHMLPYVIKYICCLVSVIQVHTAQIIMTLTEQVPVMVLWSGEVNVSLDCLGAENI